MPDIASPAGPEEVLTAGAVDREPPRRPAGALPPRTGARTWTINGDFQASRGFGLARYGQEITAALDGLLDEGHPLTRGLALRVVAPRLPAGFTPYRHIDTLVLPELRPRLPQVWVQLQLPRSVSGGLVSFGNLAPLRARRHIACIHDLQTYTVPESYGRLFRAAHRVILPRLGRRATVITTVSHASKGQLAAFGIAPAEKIAVIHNGADHARRWQPAKALRDWRRPRPFAFGIARREVHKNARLFARLAEPLDRLGIDLVLAGDIDPAFLAGAAGVASPNLHLVGRIGDDDLAAAFETALCFLFPSLTEGFGFPAVEAMVRGCPVVASTAPSLPEVCGDAALYAAPDDAGSWIAAVRTLGQDPCLRQALSARGTERARRYSWRSAAERYLELMAALDDRDGTGGAASGP